MSSSAPTPSLKLRVLATAGFAAFLALAVFGAYQGLAPGATLAPTGAPASVLGGEPGVQAGAAVTFLLQIPHGTPGEVVTLKKLDAGSLGVTLPGGVNAVNVTRDAKGNATVPVLVDVPSGTAPGPKFFSLVVDGRPQTFTVNVLAPKAAPAPRTQMLIDLTFRLDDGTLWDTSVRDVAQSSIPKSPHYPLGKTVFRPYSWSQGATTDLIPGLGPALDSMQPGERRTIVLTPENTPAWLSADPLARNVVLHRNVTIPRLAPELNVTYQALANATHKTLNETRALNVSDEVPITISLDRNAAPYSVATLPLGYQVKSKNETHLTLQVLTNKTYTQYAFAPNATEVEVRGAAVVLRTTPTVSNATVAFPAPWANVSRITAVTASNFTVTHTPTVGAVWTAMTSQGEATLRVKALTATQVIIEERNVFSPANIGSPKVYLDIVRHATATS